MQQTLAGLGYPMRDSEGHFDFEQWDAIRDTQSKNAMSPDGHSTSKLLEPSE
jgi:hypothetical protein